MGKSVLWISDHEPTAAMLQDLDERGYDDVIICGGYFATNHDVMQTVAQHMPIDLIVAVLPFRFRAKFARDVANEYRLPVIQPIMRPGDDDFHWTGRWRRFTGKVIIDTEEYNDF